MHIAKFAVNRRVTVLMMVLVVALIGAVSYSRLPVDLLPDMTFPAVGIITNFSGAAPEEVEALVTRPLEGALGTLSNIQDVQSTTVEGRSTIILQFDWNTDMDFAMLEIRERVDMVKRYLPSGVGTSNIIKFDPSMLPVMQISLGSNQLDLVEMRDLADNVVSQRLERIPGVASVSVSGGLAQQVQVSLNQSKMQQYGITISNVTNALRGSSVNLPGGHLIHDDTQYLLRTMGKVEDIDGIRNLIVGMHTRVVAAAPQQNTAPTLPPGVTLPPGMEMPAQPTTRTIVTPVYLKDVADVNLVYLDQTSISRVNAHPNVTLTLQKQSDANTVIVANLVEAELASLAADYPTIELVPTMNQADFINTAISNVTSNALLGAILAVAVLLFFLRDVRSTLIIAISVPVAIVASFNLLYFSGLTINLMTLSGLALGIGMLVDNSIVVLENIFRHLEQGEKRAAAAEKGAREVAMAITASTLTTVAVFLPVVFVGGITGKLFKELALTVSFSLLTSLIVALTVVPMLGATLLKATNKQMTRVSPLANIYERGLRWTLRHKLAVSVLVIALLAGSGLTYTRIGGEFLPSMDRGEFRLTVALPEAVPVADLEEIVQEVEAKLLSYEDVRLISTSIGISPAATRNLGTPAASRANIEVVLTSEGLKAGTGNLVNELRDYYQDYEPANVTLRYSTNMAGAIAGGGGGGAAGGGMGGFASSAVQVEFLGPDLHELGRLVRDMEGRIAELGYFGDISNSLSQSSPELQVRVDFDKAGALGLPPALVGSAVRTAFQGETATQLMHGGRELNVVVRLRPEDRSTVADLENLILVSQGDRVVRLKDVAEVVEAEGPRVINRRNNQRRVTLTASLTGRDLRTAERDIERIIDEMNLPAAYQASIGGELSEMREALNSLALALLLAIALVYMVMASQFESLVHPFTVMFTMPLAVIGVLYLLFFTGQKFNVPSMIGCIVLAGIVVNNAIVLVDYINQLRSRGRELEEAVVEAGRTRLRPILMTTLTTMLGLVPLAVTPGAGAEMQQPLAIAVIGGLGTATFLTLFIIPLVYTVFDRLLPKATNIVALDDEAVA